MVVGMSDIPSINCMRCPGESFVWVFVDEEFCTWGRHRVFVEIEGAIELGFGGDFWVDVGWA